MELNYIFLGILFIIIIYFIYFIISQEIKNAIGIGDLVKLKDKKEIEEKFLFELYIEEVKYEKHKDRIFIVKEYIDNNYVLCESNSTPYFQIKFYIDIIEKIK